MKRPCIDCGEPTNGPRCPQHRLPKPPKASPAERGYDERWRKLSKIARVMWPYCNNCGSTEDLTADHLRPGKVVESLDDIQVLCRSCNSRKGRPRGSDPLPGDVLPTRPHRQKTALRGPA